MYARVGTFQIQPGKIDEGIEIYRDSVVPAARQQQGFKGALLLTDQSSNKAISITLWETEEDMRAGEASGYLQAQLAKALPRLAAPPVVETYEVSVQRMQAGRTPLYARVITFQLQPGKIDTWTQITREAVGPVAASQPGYKGVLSLIDKSANMIIGISLWETEAAMQAGERSGYVQEQFAHVAPVLTAPPVQAAYEVTIQE